MSRGRKTGPTRSQKEALRQQRTMAQRLQVWREGRADAANRRAAEQRKAVRNAMQDITKAPASSVSVGPFTTADPSITTQEGSA